MTDDAIVGSASPEGLDDDTKLTSVRSDAHTEKAVVVAQDLVAGYFPGVNILNGSDLYAKEGELVGTLVVVAGGDLHRVTRIAQFEPP